MDGGKPEKNPSVSTWLKYADPELYEAIDDQGIMGILRPRFGSTLTFLYPAEKSYRDDIITKLNGNDATIGVNMVQALVIKDMLGDASEWLEKKDNIPNALGQKVELSSDSSNKAVVLANGATLTLNKEFKSRDDNIAVWDYKGKSQMPLDGKPAEFVKRAPRAPGSGNKRKTAAGGNGMPSFPKKSILAKRIQDQAVCLLRDGWEVFQKSNPFTAAVVSLLEYVKLRHSNKLNDFNMLCEPNSVSAFYAIVMPYSDSVFFDGAVIDSWLRETRGVCLNVDPNAAWVAHVSSLGSLGSNLHDEILDHKKDDLQRTALIATGLSVYKNKFGSNAMARLRGDELRFVIHIGMQKLGDLSAKELSNLFLDIELIYSKGSEPFFMVSNSRNDPYFMDTILTFMSSRCFASVPNLSGGKVVHFRDVMSGKVQVDPIEDLISDDDEYIKYNSSESSSTFLAGFKEVIKSMSPEVREAFLNQLRA